MPRVHTSTVVLTDVTLYRLEWGLVLNLAPGGYGAQNNILTHLTKGWKLRCLVQLGEPLHKGSRARCEQRASSLDLRTWSVHAHIRAGERNVYLPGKTNVGATCDL